jgi:hypothetical protein
MTKDQIQKGMFLTGAPAPLGDPNKEFDEQLERVEKALDEFDAAMKRRRAAAEWQDLIWRVGVQ